MVLKFDCRERFTKYASVIIIILKFEVNIFKNFFYFKNKVVRTVACFYNKNENRNIYLRV